MAMTIPTLFWAIGMLRESIEMGRILLKAGSSWRWPAVVRREPHGCCQRGQRRDSGL